MPRWLNVVSQLAGVAGQFSLAPMLPPEYQATAHAGIAMFTAIVGLVSHHYNPDGTPAAVAWRK